MPRTSRRRGDVVVLTTVSESGQPHHAFLSDDEVAFRADGRVALSLAAGSRSLGNLEAGRGAALLRSGGAPGLVTTWIARRGRTRRLAADPARRRLLAAVTGESRAVPLPGESGRLETGLTYSRREDAEEARRRNAAAAELRA